MPKGPSITSLSTLNGRSHSMNRPLQSLRDQQTICSYFSMPAPTSIKHQLTGIYQTAIEKTSKWHSRSIPFRFNFQNIWSIKNLYSLQALAGYFNILFRLFNSNKLA